MLKVALLDANVGKYEDEADANPGVTSIVGHWLEWEAQQADLALCEVSEADVILLIHAGEVDYIKHTSEAMRAYGLENDPTTRQHKPYVITGGAVDAAPLTALAVADALAVGEAYTFVRTLFKGIKGGWSISDIRDWITSYPHAIEWRQIEALQRDKAHPWLLSSPAPTLAVPDPFIDWQNAGAYEAGDGVVRLQASKGCHLKCAFCATTYRQRYAENPDRDGLLGEMKRLSDAGERVALVTNDAAALPIFEDVVALGQLRFQSMTVKALRDSHVLDVATSNRMKLVRFGVEGVSERLRTAFGKKVSNAELMVILERFRQARQQVQMFFIVGAPYETDEDWLELRDLITNIERAATKTYERLKFTTFNPQPPTPLVYFVAGTAYWRRWETFDMFRGLSRQIAVVGDAPRRPASRLTQLMDTFRLAKKDAQLLLARADADPTNTIDLAPTLEDAARFPHEMIRWPIPLAVRYKSSRVYQERLTS